MIQGAQQSGGTTPAIAPIRTLAELGEEATQRVVAADRVRRLPLQMDPRWYEQYWYSDRAPSKWRLLARALRRSGREAARVSKAIGNVVAHPTNVLGRLAGGPGKVRTSGSRA